MTSEGKGSSAGSTLKSTKDSFNRNPCTRQYWANRPFELMQLYGIIKDDIDDNARQLLKSIQQERRTHDAPLKLSDPNLAQAKVRSPTAPPTHTMNLRSRARKDKKLENCVSDDEQIRRVPKRVLGPTAVEPLRKKCKISSRKFIPSHVDYPDESESELGDEALGGFGNTTGLQNILVNFLNQPSTNGVLLPD